MVLRPKKKKTRKGALRKVLIVAKQSKEGMKYAKRLAKLLNNRVKDIDFDRSSALRLRKRGTAIKKFSGDLIITVGGDGTFLLTAHQTNAPILPVRIGGKGFLCSCDFKELIRNIDRLVKKDYEIHERMRLKCTRITKRKLAKYIDKIRHTEYPLALNEIAFARKRPSKIIRLDVRIDDVVFDYTGDGVMFSTPSGSTAYSASAGGPIIDPSLKAVGIVPLYPFFSKIKPMTIPSDKKIEVDILGGDCALVIDGHGGDYVKSTSSFVVEAADPVRVVYFDEPKFYHRLNTKLFG